MNWNCLVLQQTLVYTSIHVDQTDFSGKIQPSAEDHDCNLEMNSRCSACLIDKQGSGITCIQ